MVTNVSRLHYFMSALLISTPIFNLYGYTARWNTPSKVRWKKHWTVLFLVQTQILTLPSVNDAPNCQAAWDVRPTEDLQRRPGLVKTAL